MSLLEDKELRILASTSIKSTTLKEMFQELDLEKILFTFIALDNFLKKNDTNPQLNFLK